MAFSSVNEEQKKKPVVIKNFRRKIPKCLKLGRCLLIQFFKNIEVLKDIRMSKKKTKSAAKKEDKKILHKKFRLSRQKLRMLDK